MTNSQLICPACLGRCAAPPMVCYGADEAAQHFVLKEEFPDQHLRLRDKIVSLWGASHCDMHRCPGCGLVFAQPFRAGDGEFYNLAYPYSSYPQQRWEFLETLRALESQSAGFEGGKVLEIGSGFGHFLRQLAPRHLPAANVLAIEYNDVARRRLLADGFRAFGEDVRSPAFDSHRGSLDAVFMFQVLEHMDDLDGLFRRLQELLRPGASMYIAVPNQARLAFSHNNGSLRDMPPNHISQWTEPAFGALARRFGLEVVEFRVEPMSLVAFARLDLVFSHMRRAQRSGSLANRVRSWKRTRARVLSEGALAVAAAPTRLLPWWRASRSPQPLGDSVWVHLRAPALR